jgi:hypothetical protein
VPVFTAPAQWFTIYEGPQQTGEVAMVARGDTLLVAVSNPDGQNNDVLYVEIDSTKLP